MAKLLPFLFVLLIAVSLSSSAQTHMPTMHGNVRHLNQQEPALTPQPTKPDPVKVQREAQELLQLSQSLQPDIDSANRGVLPKDTIDKLKRIQKLAKHLRGELEP